MPRWAANSRERIALAALELFVERGYDATTITDISERAGLTKSTFFRHFADKREALFGGQDDMIASLTQAVAALPPVPSPLTCVLALFAALSTSFPSGHRAFVALRSRVIRANPELYERELLKGAQLMTAFEHTLRARGFDDFTVRLTATIGMLAFQIGYERWMASASEETVTDHATRALNELTQQASSFETAIVH